MRGDRGHCPGGRCSASGRRRGSRYSAGRGVGPAMAVVDGPRPRRRPPARGRGPEQSCCSARPEARHPDTGPSDDRRVPVGASAIHIGEAAYRALGSTGLRSDSRSPGKKEQFMEAQVRSTDAVMSANGSGMGAGPGPRHEDAAPTATAPRFDPRTRVLLEGPIVSTLLRLATPNVLVMFVQAAVASSRRISSASSEPMRWPASSWSSPH
jgi:hypothetical protein